MDTPDPRIDPLNYPLLARYPADHPAVRVLHVQAEARDICVGKEIGWPDEEEPAIDQEWFSLIDQRTWTFSAIAYCFISFDLIVHDWRSEPLNALGPFEASFLAELPRLLGLLGECESAAHVDGNHRILPLILKAREFFTTYEESILARTGPVKVDAGPPTQTLWSAGRR